MLEAWRPGTQELLRYPFRVERQPAGSLYVILQTAAKHNLNVQAYLRYYLDACAAGGGGPPPDLERFLPWKIPDEIIREYGMRAGRNNVR